MLHSFVGNRLRKDHTVYILALRRVTPLNDLNLNEVVYVHQVLQ